MKLTIKELRETILEAQIEHYLWELINEDMTDAIPTPPRVWTGKDIHNKVQSLIDKATKLRKIAAKETKPIKFKLYSRLSDQMMSMAEKLNTEYEITKDPNVIHSIYKEFGFDPRKV